MHRVELDIRMKNHMNRDGGLLCFVDPGGASWRPSAANPHEALPEVTPDPTQRYLNSVRNHTHYMHSGPTMRLRLRLNGPFGTKAVGPILQKALP
jgi:hypothetical protein